MEQLVATYGTKSNTSLATTATSTAAQPLDPKQWEALAQKQNVPGFLLLDAVRFYKRGQTAQETLTPVVNSAKEDVDNVKKEMHVLRDDFRKDQERLGRVETSVDTVSKGLERLEGELDTVRRENLGTNLDAKKNGRDVGGLAVRFDALEEQLSVLLAQEKHNLRVCDGMRAHVMELSGVIARMEQTGLSRLHNQWATLSSGRAQYHHGE
jgi:chromosome segregation ATPase